MRTSYRYSRTLRTHVSRLSFLVLLLVANVVYALPPEPKLNESGGAGAVSYWLLAFLLAVNVAGLIHMRRWAATIQSGEDKE